MNGNLQPTRATPVPPFRAGGEFTLGAEDELLLVDRCGELADVSEETLARTRQVPGADARREIFTCELELGTPVVESGDDLADSLARARAAVAGTGHTPIAVGVHPTAGPGTFRMVHSARYDMVADEFAGLFRTPTASFQVHVGMPDSQAMVAAYRGLRNRLALFRALAAGSPFWHGRDSGLASARAALMWSYPRVGVPPAFGTYEEYQDLAHEQIAAAEAPDYTYLWWDLRPHPCFGTLELRVMDSVPSLDLVAGLAALAQGLARSAAETPPTADLPTPVLRENDFRAARYGLDTRVTDVDGRMRPLREIATEAIASARRSLRTEGTGGPLDALARSLDAESECERQRRLMALEGAAALLADVADRTQPALRRAAAPAPVKRWPPPAGGRRGRPRPPRPARHP